MQEIWKTIDGFSRYEISNFGQVRSWCTLRNVTEKSNKYRILKQYTDKDGYITITLYPDDKNSRAKRLSLHRLVATYFVKNDDPINKTYVNHKDENKKNNYASNLEWCTCQDNLLYSKIHERGMKTKIKNKACNAEKPIVAIKDGKICFEFKSVAEAGRDPQFSPWGLQLVLSGKRQTYKGYIWKYKGDLDE